MEKKAKCVILKNLTREYISPNKTAFRAVDDVSLEIIPGEFVTLLGPSGCGKTTTLRMIAGFETPTAGEVWIGDELVNAQTPDKRDTAMVFQSYALFPHYNVYNNISFGLRLKKLPKEEISQKVQSIMHLVGLDGLDERFPNQLSGGQQQRVALARALVSEPSVMLFDEPLSNLDAKLRTSMRNEIRRIQKRVGRTSIYVTHDQSEAMALSDRIIVMNHGIIEQIGTPHEIYFTPASRFVADFIGRSNFIPCEIVGKDASSFKIELFGKKLSVTIKNVASTVGDAPVTCMCRPESVLVGKEGLLEGTIISSTFMGAMQEYYVDVCGHTFIVEDYNFRQNEAFSEGRKVGISFKPESLHLINK